MRRRRSTLRASCGSETPARYQRGAFGAGSGRVALQSGDRGGLRHTFGTQMAAASALLRAIQEWMGHADTFTTGIYAHYAPDPTGGAKFADRAFGSGRGPDLPAGLLAS